MAATNYAIEGVTGEWTVGVANSKVYEAGAREGMTETGMRWLRAHADYDDTHPWEALHIIALILGKNPPAARVRSVRDAIRKSYNLYQMSVDVGLAFTHDEVPSAAVSYSAAALS